MIEDKLDMLSLSELPEELKKIYDFLISKGFESKSSYKFEKETKKYNLRFCFGLGGKVHVTVYIKKTDINNAKVFFPFSWVLANKLVLVKWLVKESISLVVHELNEAPIATSCI